MCTGYCIGDAVRLHRFLNSWIRWFLQASFPFNYYPRGDKQSPTGVRSEEYSRDPSGGTLSGTIVGGRTATFGSHKRRVWTGEACGARKFRVRWLSPECRKLIRGTTMHALTLLLPSPRNYFRRCRCANTHGTRRHYTRTAVRVDG